MFRILKTPELLFLNKYTQGLVTQSEIIDWFLMLHEVDKQKAVADVWVLATQARIREEDVPEVLTKAGLKPTHTPVIMLTKGKIPFHKHGLCLSTLKGTVLKQAFLLVLECFAYAERRRKKNEDPLTCNHWWHKDLSDEEVIRDILKNY